MAGYGWPMRSAFITGAATGIGEALVVRLQHEGWQVFAAYRGAARWPRRDRVRRCMRSTGVRVDEIVDDFAIAQFRWAVGDLGLCP